MTDAPSTPESAAISEERYVLIKRGLYERPEGRGYTGIKDHAGLYSKQEADACVGRGGSAMPFDEAPEFSPSCYEDLARAHLQGKIDDLRARLAAAEGERDEAREKRLVTEAQILSETARANGWKARLTTAEARVAELEGQVQRFRDERSYVVGWNDGYEHARDAYHDPNTRDEAGRKYREMVDKVNRLRDDGTLPGEPRPVPKLEDLIDRAKRFVMTPEQHREQRRSWVRGQYMMSHPEATREEADALIDRALPELRALKETTP